MPIERISRRIFLNKLGKGTLAIAIFGLAACSDSALTTDRSTTTIGGAVGGTDPPPQTSTTSIATPDTGGLLSYRRVVLGSVSAFVLIRNDEAAVVDTGNPGSAGDIEAALGAFGVGWNEVKDVILTHLHGDHIGSVSEVLNRAQSATVYAGEADISSIPSPRPLIAAGDGDEVFGLEIVETPGHTPGHISVFDTKSRILVAGDALRGGDDEVLGSSARFTADIPAADASVQKLAALQPDIILFGHGEPVEGGAAELLE